MRSSLVSVSFFVLGCSSARTEQRIWVNQSGGLLEDQHQARAERAFERIHPQIDGDPRIRVLNSSEIGAHAWPDGYVYMTRGLMDVMNDDELAAAIAHELGHLINDGHLHTVVSLRGCCKTPDAEARADATGVELLRSRGIDPHSMSRMLRKVENCPEIGARCRSGIAWRLQLVEDLLGTGKFMMPGKPSS